MKAALLIVLSLAVAAWAQDQKQLANDMLQRHNNVRGRHRAGNMGQTNDLNDRAVKCARYYANKDKIDHTCPEADKDNDGPLGENLAWSSYNGSPDYSRAVATAANGWYKENEGYNYDDPGNSQGVTGHFTQMVWKSSNQLGTGVANNPNSKRVYVVSIYKPAGNMQMRGDRYKLYRENVLRP